MLEQAHMQIPPYKLFLYQHSKPNMLSVITMLYIITMLSFSYLYFGYIVSLN